MTVWEPAHRQARVADALTGRRHPAGSPDSAEIEAYAAALPSSLDAGVLVLGGTPELRQLAADRSVRTVVLDRDAGALTLPIGWPAAWPHERAVQGDWTLARAAVGTPVDAVVGDGVFGQLPDEVAHRALLASIADALGAHGRFVTRHAAVPDGLDVEVVRWQRLVQHHREGAIDDASFGLGARVLGHLSCCWDEGAGILDNERLFGELDAAHSDGVIDDHQHACIERYRAGGTTSLLPQRRWESLLTDAGWRLERTELSGRWWYSWYAVYACDPPPPAATASDR